MVMVMMMMMSQSNEQELMSSIKHALMLAGREYWDEFTKVRCEKG